LFLGLVGCYYHNFDQATISRIERKQQGKDTHHNTLYVLDKYFSGVHVMVFLCFEALEACPVKAIGSNGVEDK
jgi:hypothetical protein